MNHLCAEKVKMMQHLKASQTNPHKSRMKFGWILDYGRIPSPFSSEIMYKLKFNWNVRNTLWQKVRKGFETSSGIWIKGYIKWFSNRHLKEIPYYCRLNYYRVRLKEILFHLQFQPAVSLLPSNSPSCSSRCVLAVSI